MQFCLEHAEQRGMTNEKNIENNSYSKNSTSKLSSKSTSDTFYLHFKKPGHQIENCSVISHAYMEVSHQCVNTKYVNCLMKNQCLNSC